MPYLHALLRRRVPRRRLPDDRDAPGSAAGHPGGDLRALHRVRSERRPREKPGCDRPQHGPALRRSRDDARPRELHRLRLRLPQRQTALLRGAHHAVEKFFRMQRDTNNHLGPEGPGWPRFDHDAPNRASPCTRSRTPGRETSTARSRARASSSASATRNASRTSASTA